ncbi:diguanylate cyclase [Massilia sp. DWR3-1-1]|uniref:diguanylate cyclase n=1 Tax=Massilia sp. DWR3-1-1 TaxID=2804559 RepID=UPI003CF5B7D6
MTHPDAERARKVGLFLNPVPARRVQFQADSGDRFGRLFVAADADEAARILAQEAVDLLIIDLDRFDRAIDAAPLARLVRQRAGAAVLLLCAYGRANWLTELAPFGPLDYLLEPAGAAELGQRIDASLAGASAGQAGATVNALRSLLALRSSMLQAVAGADDGAELASAVCAALARWPGVVHAALLETSARGELIVSAQHARGALDLAHLLDPAIALLDSPLRHRFPPLIAACDGELAVLDDLDRCADAGLAGALAAMHVAMVVGVPIAARGPGAPLGALCLMFETAQRLSADDLATLEALAREVGLGLRLAEMNGDAEQLLARLTDLATLDALTGVANRGRGEALLEQEIKRARRYATPLALITIDVDHFKAINDRYGHPVGDAALRVLAQAIRAELRSSDWLARSGGDEFQIVATHTNAIDGLKMAEKIRQAIGATTFPGFDRLAVSMAVAQAGADESADALMVRAAAAMARAKRAGRNCVELAMQ